MPLAEEFQEILDALPSDWTDLELDLRVQESRYIDAAQLLVTCNAQPYSRHDWHFHLNVAHQFGHAAAAPTFDAVVVDLFEERERWRQQPDYACFWSSPDNPRGLRLTPHVGPGRVWLRLRIEREHSGIQGIAHGGVRSPSASRAPFAARGPAIALRDKRQLRLRQQRVHRWERSRAVG